MTNPHQSNQVHRDMKTLCVQMDAFMRTSPFLPYEDVSDPRVFERTRVCALALPDQRASKCA